MKVGIAGLGYYNPEPIMTAKEIADRSKIPEEVFTEKIGLQRKHVAGKDDHPATMGAIAAKRALANANLDPEQIDIIIHCGTGYYEYQYWSPAAKIQHLIGSPNSYAFEIRNGCNGGNLALEVAKNLLIGDKSKKNALVVCSDVMSVAVNYDDPASISAFTYADGAAAAVLCKGCHTNSILAYAAITDGSLADYVKVPFGGTKFPPQSENIPTKDKYFQVSDSEELDKIFSIHYIQNYQRAIEEALEKSHYSISDVSFLFTNQVKRSVSEGILSALDLSVEKTMITLKDFGHQGPVDTFFCLARAMEMGMIKPGALVVLASSAIGFSWAASVIKFS